MAGKDRFSKSLMELSVDELIKKRDELRAFLQTLEDDYRKSAISEEAYNEAKRKNQKKLDAVISLLADWGIKDEPPKPSEEPSGETPRDTSEEGIKEKDVSIEEKSVSSGTVDMGLVEEKIKTETDKLQAMIDAVKETGAAMDDRLQKLTESIGEIRSLVYQRESSIRDIIDRLERLEEEVKLMQPERFEKELSKRDRRATEDEMKIEKLEVKVSEIVKIVDRIRRIMESIGGLENISEVNQKIREHMAEIEGAIKYVKQLSKKIEKMYVDMNKKTEDFILYKSKQDTMSEVINLSLIHI